MVESVVQQARSAAGNQFRRSASRLVCRGIAKGNQLWQFPLQNGHVTHLVGDASYVVCTKVVPPGATQLVYLDKSSGKELWKKSLASRPRSVALGEKMAFISGQMQKESEQAAPMQDELMNEVGGAPAVAALGTYGMPVPFISGIELNEGKEVWRKQNVGGSLEIREGLLLSVRQIAMTNVLNTVGGMLDMFTQVKAMLPRNGKRAWSYIVKANMRQCVIRKGTVFLVTEKNETRLGANGPEPVVFESRLRAVRRRNFGNRMLVF